MNCGEITMALKKCVDAHPEYYGTLSEAPEKETEKKEAVTPAEAPAEAPEKVEAPVTPVETPVEVPEKKEETPVKEEVAVVETVEAPKEEKEL